MRRELSSGMTVFFKFVFPAFWIAILGLGTVLLFLDDGKGKWDILTAWLLGTGFFYLFTMRLKTVYLDKGFLYISDFRRTIRVPVGEIAGVRENMWFSVHPVWIEFKHPTELGKTIMFMPYFHLSKWLIDTHPVVTELRKLARLPRDEYT